MLLANETVAAHLERAGMPALYRIHEPPDPQKVETFEAFIDSLGYALARTAEQPAPKDFQSLIERMRGTPEEKPMAFLLLRTMQKARYDTANVGHFGLAADSYTHFTSPIRRYPDLVVHRLLREMRRMNDERRDELVDDLPEVARHTSDRERRASDAERELVQWKKVRFMADKVGDEFEGYVTGVSAFGLYVELVEHFVEGMVHVSTMADDYYRFVEAAHVLRGENTGRVLRLGDRLTVQVIRVDLERRQIDLGIAEILEAVRARSPRDGRRASPKGHGRERPVRRQRPGRRERARTKGKGTGGRGR